MWTYDKYSRLNWYRIKLHIKSFMKPHKLCYKTQIWIYHFSFHLKELKCFFVIVSSCKYKITHDYCCRSRNSLNTMHKYSPILSFALFNKINCIIKYTFNVFNWVIFQMILFINEITFMIILTVVTWTIDNMSNFIF